MRLAPTLLTLALGASLAAAVHAKLPPLSDDAKAKAAETAAKAAWSDKVQAYHMCQIEDRLADQYRKTSKSSGKEAQAPVATPPCADPGPFIAPAPPSQKPLEASGAHSPAGNATSPPSVNATSGEMAPKK